MSFYIFDDQARKVKVLNQWSVLRHNSILIPEISDDLQSVDGRKCIFLIEIPAGLLVEIHWQILDRITAYPSQLLNETD